MGERISTPCSGYPELYESAHSQVPLLRRAAAILRGRLESVPAAQAAASVPAEKVRGLARTWSAECIKACADLVRLPTHGGGDEYTPETVWRDSVIDIMRRLRDQTDKHRRELEALLPPATGGRDD